jgi:2-dehydro-3-deoxyphosphogluconate aldolase / (4S)-4-hydroxy-2-oxoglutarate aldolase
VVDLDAKCVVDRRASGRYTRILAYKTVIALVSGERRPELESDAGSPRSSFIEELSAHRLVAVIRAGHEFDVRQLGEVLLDERVRFIEVTLTTPGALEAITYLQSLREQRLRIGAGTVLTTDDAEAALRAGVDFLVSPTVEPAVASLAHDAGCAAIIGALTPTEILAAWRAGADVVKVFPGRIATPEYFADLAGPLPHIPLMPTGNVDLETAPAYLRAGAIAVGVGKALVNPDYLRAGQFDLVRSDIARWRQLASDAGSALP